jgi:uncharacterized protein with HEPN domain
LIVAYILGILLTVNPPRYVGHPTYCISEWLAVFNVVISLYFLVAFEKVLETVNTELVQIAVTLNAMLVKNVTWYL